jgi:putative ABC transport system permease protein
MLKSYLKTAMRFLLKNKTFSLINVFGLAMGTLSCLYILLYVQDQYSYDKHHKDGQDIYRVTTMAELTGDKHKIASASPPIAPAIKLDFPEVIQFARLYSSDVFGNDKSLLKYKDRSFHENGLVFVDSTFFDVLSYHFVYGKNTRDILAEPYSIVLSKPTAIKLFGNVDPVGKVVTIDNNYGKHDFKVNGEVDESLGKTHINANIFVTMRSGGFGRYLINNSQWAGNNMMCSYIKLRPGSDPVALEKKLPAFLNKHGAQQLKALGMTKSLHLQPLASVHTTPGYEFEIGNTVSPTLLYILAGIAIMIQLIACINFMNLSTARASKRAKEVGVRKVIGAGKADLVLQFLGESFLLSLIGVLLALPLLYLFLPYLNGITHTEIQLSFLNHYSVWLVLAAIVIITGAVAGSYPAFYLSAFQAVKVMKGNFSNQVSATGIRRSLVVFQFFLSIVLITSIIIIYSQLNYIKNKDLGFDKNQKLIFTFYTDDTRQKMKALATDIQQLSEVKQVSLSDGYLSHNGGSDFPVYLAGGNQLTSVDATNMAADEKFVKANGIKIIAGRDFDVKDTLKTLINETLCKRLSLTAEKAPGTRLYSKYFDGTIHYFDIVGVMKDFNYDSLHGEVGPFMIFHNGNPGNYFSFMTVSVSSTDYRLLLSKMGMVWQRNLPGVPFEYAFLDQEVQKQYAAEISLSNIINSFTIMAILISCLGLFGLAAFSAEQRQKEIGIRKVLGASVAGIAGLLSKEFVKLVGIAFILATPLSWWAMNKWLEAFAYKVPVSWWMFAVAGALSTAIALITVSFQAIKAALVNPMRSLKTE